MNILEKPLSFVESILPDGYINTPYDQYLHGQGGKTPYKFELTSNLPAGFNFSANDSMCEVKGISTSVVLNYPVKIKLTDADGAIVEQIF